MILEKLNIIICLLGGLAVVIVSIITGQELSRALLDLFIALVVFYILGGIIKFYLDKKVFPKPIEPEEIEEGSGEEAIEEAPIEEEI